MIDKKYADLAKLMAETVPWVKDSGIKLLDAEDGYIRAMMPREKHVNHVGIAFAGTHFSIMECVGAGITAVSYPGETWIPIIKEVNIQYKKPLLTDIYCEMRLPREKADELIAPLREKNKGEWVINMEVKNAEGEVCSTAKWTFYLKRFA